MIASLWMEKAESFITQDFITLRACKGFHQSAASAKLNPELRLFIEPVKDSINRLRVPN
jgi:hypothetical protein